MRHHLSIFKSSKLTGVPKTERIKLYTYKRSIQTKRNKQTNKNHINMLRLKNVLFRGDLKLMEFLPSLN